MGNSLRDSGNVCLTNLQHVTAIIFSLKVSQCPDVIIFVALFKNYSATNILGKDFNIYKE